jgi:diguanylate cyclase (GGDEF)-like protein/PAS domain S-box-containing protein
MMSLFFKPVYLSNPKHLNAAERQRQVKGVAFIAIPTEKILLEFAQKHFAHQPLRIQANFKSNQTQFSKVILDTLPAKVYSLPGLKQTFTSALGLNLSNPNSTLNITLFWPLSELKTTPIIVSSLLALALYGLVMLILLLAIRYTKNLQQAQNRLSQILYTSQDAVIVTNQQGYIQEWNPEASRLFGYSQEAALGQCIVCLIFENPDNLDPSTHASEAALIDIFTNNLNLKHQQGHANRVEVTLRTQTGERLTAEVATALLNVQDDLEISLFIKDMTYQRRTEAEIKQLAYYDPLTKLENRTHFKSQVEQIIHQQRFEKFALLFLDLDGFKQVNDTLGHSVGDELLVVISKRITHTLRSSERDTHICRFGGDEFVLMLGHVGETDAPAISLRLLAQIERLVKIKEDDLHVSGSIGIALYPQHGQDVDTLLRHADTAMYQSKAAGKNTYSIYNDLMEQDLSKRTQLEKHLRHAIRNQEFSLVYQPQIDLKTGMVVGVEALIRWNNPILGHVPPDEFISIAEESNQIIAIGDWVAQTCINQLSAWKNSQFDYLHIALNVSGVQFEHPYFLETIRVMMNQANISRHLLEIELTERTIMGNVTENIARFNNIRAEGFGLSVDDFGTGYSSLSYLKKFPLSVLKIDKSFIDGLPDDDEDVSIASAIINLAHSLNMQVVAEGVETLGQLDFLKRLNCNKAQGYFISRPLTIEQLEPWLQRHKQGFFTADNSTL